MKIKCSAPTSARRNGRQAASGSSPAQPQFKMRLLTLAVLSACTSTSMAAQNRVAAPVNRLPTGGVVVNPGSASIINQSPNRMVIKQTAQKATFRWDSFDIAQGNSVHFDQPNAAAEAMNFIGGARPSVIQGTLSANGKVYLVNSNGILFDGTAQVNVNTLIASSLDISQQTFDGGITSSLDGDADPALVATMLLDSAGQVVNYGTIRSVKVDGASGEVVTTDKVDIKTGQSVQQPVEEGGSIMLFAPQVENHGLITANNGQVILAAGKSVYLKPYNHPASDNYKENDLSMRGFLVKVTAAPEGALNLSNLIAAKNLNSAANLGGEIRSDRGNTTLTGLIVNQSGRISASTATTLNGSIWLKAENYDAASKQTIYGSLTTSKDSVTETLPEADGTTLAESTPYADNKVYSPGGFQAVIKLVGETIVHEGQARAPGGRIEVGKEYVSNDPSARPPATGRVYLGADSVLSTAGEWVDLAYESNFLSFKLGSLDLADSPLQKGGFLINQTVTVDTREASPLLFDITKKVSGVQRSVKEKATAGGMITVNTGEFIAATGSSVDVSGGGYRYRSGTQTTTYLKSRGRLFDIKTAPTNLKYDGVVNNTAKVNAYVEGKDAGILAIDAKQMVFGGRIAGGVTTGPTQRAASAMPALGKLVLGTQSITADLDFSKVEDASTTNNLDIDSAVYVLQDVEFGASAATRQQLADALALARVSEDPAHAALPAALLDEVLLPVDMFGGIAYSNAQASASQGFGTLTLRANGSITLPQDVTLDLGSGGSLLWLAPQIELAGTVRAQGGALAFNQRKDNTLLGTTHLGAHSVVSTAGGWINDAAGMTAVPNVVDGGSVVIEGSSTLDAGALIDVSGGALLAASGKLSYGNGGAIALPTVALDGVSLHGYGGKQGGSLTLDTTANPFAQMDVGGASADALQPGFFTQGGFTHYTLAGSSQVNFNESIHLVADQRIARANAQLSPTGTDFAAISSVQPNTPDYLRTASSLTASTGASNSGLQLGANETGITVASGVSIRTAPLGHIDLSSQTRMNIEGSLVAPAGSISLSLDPGNEIGSRFFYDTASGRFNALKIGDQSVISTAGIFLPTIGLRGLTTGQVLAGGTVSIVASKNDLVIAPGAVVDVSGASQAVDLASGSGGANYVRTQVASEGGQVVIEATGNAYLDGTFKGKGGDATVAGGRFELNLPYHGQFLGGEADDVLFPVTSRDANAEAALKRHDANGQQLGHSIVVSQLRTPLAHDNSSADSSKISNLVDASGNFVGALRANISADQLVNGTKGGGGFDSVVLKSDTRVQFNAGVNNFAPRARLQLDTPELWVEGAEVIRVGSGSQAGAGWQTAQIGWVNTPNGTSGFRRSTYPAFSQVPVATQAGAGELGLAASQITLAGNLAANGVAELNLLSSGDIRFEGFPLNAKAQALELLTEAQQALSGRLSSAGNITLQADQVYPATAVNFTVAVEQVSSDPASLLVSRNPVVEGLLTILGNDGAERAPVLSAGGVLTLNADHIRQAGTLKAPLGSIVLEGGQSLKLESGSVTSVSALWQHDGVETELVIPYGYTQSVGQTLWYGGLQTTSAPSKQIEASADAVTVAPGATVDIRGGGDFAAVEWVPGIGGSKDVLAAPGTYAIVPGVLFQTADSHLDSLAPVGVNAGAPYNMVHLDAGSALPEGDYALLPAYYALLPGAYLVKAQNGATYANLNPGTAVTQADGSVVVAGKLGYSGTGIRQSTWSGYSIQSGAAALTQTAQPQAEYLVTGSKFFTDKAAKNNSAVSALPSDGGRFSVGATSSLAFEGNLLAKAARDAATGAAGAIGQVDIYGSKIAIVDNRAAVPSGFTRLQADDLSKLEASVLIGGKRSDTANGQSLDVVASEVTVDLDDGELKLPELWLAAKDQLTVSGDSNLTAAGTVANRSGTLTVNPDSDGNQYGALLGLSSGELAPVVRAGTLDNTPAHGNLTIETGAKLIASGGSIAVDSTGTPRVEEGVLLTSDTLAIGARRIALGAAPVNGDALVLGSAQLAALSNAKNFVLRSYSSIDLYGNVNLGQVGTGSFTFDSAGLVGHDVGGASAPVDLSASTITLQNLSGTALAPTAPGTGTLTLNADKLVLAESGTAGFTLGGFQQVDVQAKEVSLQGGGTLTVASDLAIETARIAAGTGLADQKIKAYDDSQQVWHDIKLTQPVLAPGASAPTFAAAPLPGGKLKIDASAVDFGSSIDLQSGRLEFVAHGTAATDGVTLKTGSSIDLSSYEKTFAQGSANLTESASAGRFTMSSDNGSVDAQSGSSIDLQGGAAGGDAGVLTVAAANGTVSLDGTLLASAAVGKSGSANIDAKDLANFSALNSKLETARFGERRYMRARTGNVEVAATDTVTAQAVQVVADSGSIDVRGTIDASGIAGGGEVELDAGQGIHLFGSSRILANGTSADTAAGAAYSDGGTVGLYARNGALDFDSGAVIDVSAAATGKSSGGEIVFSAPRTADGSNLRATLAGQVKVAGGTVSVPGGRVPESGKVIVEGFKSYSGITTTSTAASTSDTVYADFATFMGASDAIQSAALTTLTAADSDVSSAGLKVRAGVELVSDGDMTVDADWDLTDSSWLPVGATQTAGRLALRAAGNLAVNARVGLPNESALPPDAGWSLQLAGGADTRSADALAVNASTTQGDVTLSSSGKLTSSTGDIQIAAGRDFIAASTTSVVYTTGRALALPILSGLGIHESKVFAPSTGVNFVDGGSISISAQRDITGSGGYANVNDWLRRNTVVPGLSLTSSVLSAGRGYAYQPAYWWVDRQGNTTAKTKGIEGIATLGGGDIAIVAENTVKNLSVASATSRSATTTATPVLVNDRNNIPSENAVYGGGDVRIDAGGDLLGGQYLVGRGTASLAAGGEIGGLNGVADSATAPAFWLMGWSDDLALRGAEVKVEAQGSVTLGSAANPTVTLSVKSSGATITNPTPGYRGNTSFGAANFFSYAPEDSLAINSVGGDVVVAPVTELAKNVLPPRFSAVAMEGSVSSGASQFNAAATGTGGHYQFPDSNGQFRLLAGQSVHDLVLLASDYDPAILATAGDQTLGVDAFTVSKILPDIKTSARMVTPSTLDGYRYAVVAETGDVSNAWFYFPQRAVVVAGQDVANVQLDLQNLSAGDVSYVAAGRDVLYSNVLSNGSQWNSMPYLQIAGAGNLLVEAGRDINLGAVTPLPTAGLNDVNRIDAIGNLVNASLPTADSANLTLVSGVDTGTLGLEQTDSLFGVLRSAGQLQDLLGQVQGNKLSGTAAIADANTVVLAANVAIDALFAGTVQTGSAPVYQTPISPDGSGSSAADKLSVAYKGALAASNNAIAALFKDGQSRQGDITMFNARVSSNSNPGGSGGTINLLAPNGDIKVGLPSASSGRDIGIFTKAGGAINAYLSGDMNVNLSKVATFQGGDILLYTSGDGSTLDAGRGSRSARTSSPPRLVEEKDSAGNPTGKILLLPPSDVSGSGIRTVSYDPDGAGSLQQPDPGKVYLIAPTGTIDAGEAGVSSASGLVVAALVVKNAENFSAGGSSVGVPSVSSAPAAAPVSSDAGNANKASDALAKAGNALADASKDDFNSFRPTLVSVEVLGFGKEGENAECKKGDPDCLR